MSRLHQNKLFLIISGGCAAFSFFICEAALADTILFKDGSQMKGLVVEKHVDRLIVSTEKGEKPVFLKDVKDVRYDSPDQNFMEIGAAYEKDNKLGEALAYYEKAVEANPNNLEARRAATGVRNRFQAVSTEGPREEIEKQRLIFEAWNRGVSIEDVAETEKKRETQELRQGLGLDLEKKGDWVQVAFAHPKKPAAQRGLRKNDRFVAIDGKSLRYLGEDVVLKSLLVPRYSSFTLEFERDLYIHPEPGKTSLRDLGFKLKLKYQGLVVSAVNKESAAARAGLKKGDLLVEINGEMTRYMPMNEAIGLIESTAGDRIVFTVRRAVMLARR